MGLFSWLKRKHYEETQQKISQMQLDIHKFGVGTARDTAEREASVLKSLRESVYKQDEGRIRSLINLFDQLDSQQSEMVGKVNQIKERIATRGVLRGSKKTVNSLVKNLETMAKNFDTLIKQNRADIERIKASIKANTLNLLRC